MLSRKKPLISFKFYICFFSGETMVLREVSNCKLGVRFLKESMQCLDGEELNQVLNKQGIQMWFTIQ